MKQNKITIAACECGWYKRIPPKADAETALRWARAAARRHGPGKPSSPYWRAHRQNPGLRATTMRAVEVVCTACDFRSEPLTDLADVHEVTEQHLQSSTHRETVDAHRLAETVVRGIR